MSASAPSTTTRLRWELITGLFVLGFALCVAAFVADAHGASSLTSSALLQFGGTIGLVGVLFVVERQLIARLAPVVTVNVLVRREGSGAEGWREHLTARPGETIEILIRFANAGKAPLENVVVGNNLPRYLAYVPATTRLRNGAFPSSVEITSDRIVDGGIDVGNYESGAVGYVWFGARLDARAVYPQPRHYELRNIGLVRPEGIGDCIGTAGVTVDVT